jgi:hypothetical protein
MLHALLQTGITEHMAFWELSRLLAPTASSLAKMNGEEEIVLARREHQCPKTRLAPFRKPLHPNYQMLIRS